MSKHKITPNHNAKLLQDKVEAKLKAIKAYYSGSEPSFGVPPVFTFNWFANLSEGDLEAFSRSSRAVDKGKPLRKEIEAELAKAESFRKKSKAVKKSDIDTIKNLKQENQKLKDMVADLDGKLQTQVNATLQLRRELEAANTRLGIKQAQWNQEQSKVRKVAFVKAKPKADAGATE